MKILGIDTTAGEGSVSLFAGGRPAATLRFEGGRKHSVNLFQAVEDLIRQSGCALRDVDLISVAAGPGSFTGIRVGLAAAKGWAEALGKPVVGVSVLEAMAADFSFSTGLGKQRANQGANPVANQWTVPVLDAERGELYAGFYRPSGQEAGRRTECAPPEAASIVLKASEFPQRLREKFGEEACFTLLVRAGQRTGAALQSLGDGRIAVNQVRTPMAELVARLGEARFGGSGGGQPEALTAFYLRRPDAEIHWKD
ncbi:MAG: tRNA (adenosine(37)-N6)-threonylcarbamoyltransferase complex dimerization subunit type 1 TsaB [Acidobacteria bacterium]|nr:tRNA (adenosine(37)-N6)-threonylcarbamoyltransferase complex dimerization subunit type 1 TsaB [Acidobacteriota bacterium]